MQHLVNVHFSCPGLYQCIKLYSKPAMLYFVFNEVRHLPHSSRAVG